MMEDRGKFVAIATYHDQPPINTPARIWTEAKQFSGTDELADVWKWLTTGTGIPNKLEIVPDA